MSAVQLRRDGCSPCDVQIAQLTPVAVANAFELDVTTVWLKEIDGTRAFFPDASGSSFQFTNDVGRSIMAFLVNGCRASAIQVSTSAIGGRYTTPSVVCPSSLQTRVTSYRPIFGGKRGSGSSVNIKVVKASMTRLPTGKLEFAKLGQTFIDVDESTANVDHISGFIREKWGDDQVLVTADGLKIDDSSGTRGLKFWKVGSRKVYAVTKSSLHRMERGKGRKQVIELDSDSDDDEFPPPQLKKSKQLNHVVQEIKSLHNDMKKVLQLTKGMRLPPGVYLQLLDTFKCRICYTSPIRPPVIFTRCCKNILGCNLCVDTWFTGDDGRQKSCPLCRAPRAFTETMQINGLDDFLAAIAPLVGDDDATPGPSLRNSGSTVHSIGSDSSSRASPFVIPAPLDDSDDDDFELPPANV